MLPNLVIGGAPKCGTSSIFRWLADHPQTCASHKKETFYLIDPDNPLLPKRHHFHAKGLAGYHECFGPCSEQTRVIFEATTHYLYSHTALQVLPTLPSNPRLVFILRRPSARVYSSFRYMKNNQAQMAHGVTFAHYVDAIQRADNSSLEAMLLAPENIFVARHDLDYSTYDRYLERWIAALGLDRIGVFLFEDLIRDPRSFMKNLCAFINLDPSFFDLYDFPKQNQTLAVRQKWIHRLARKIGPALPANRFKNHLKALYLNLQTKQHNSAPPLSDADTLRALDQHFRGSHARVQSLTHIDTSTWTT